jgi:hypothetical protein
MNQHYQTHHCALMHVINRHIDKMDVLGSAVSVYSYLEDTTITLIDFTCDGNSLMAHEQSNVRYFISAVLLLCQELIQVLRNVTVEICQLKRACDGCSMKLPL